MGTIERVKEIIDKNTVLLEDIETFVYHKAILVNTLKDALSTLEAEEKQTCVWKEGQISSRHNVFIPINTDLNHPQTYIDSYLIRQFILCPYCGKRIDIKGDSNG